MGARYVGLALNRQWADLSPFARLVLVTMAHRVMDRPSGDQPEALYWGGHQAIARDLCGVMDDGDPRWPAAQQRIKKAIRELTGAGAVAVFCRAVNSRRAVYDLTTLNRFPLPVDNCPESVDELVDGPVDKSALTGSRGSSQTPSGGPHRPPQGVHTDHL